MNNIKGYLIGWLIIIILGTAWYFTRPSIQEINAATQKNIDGAWIIQYEYALDGVPQIVFLQDDKALKEYRAYLKRIGRFHE